MKEGRTKKENQIGRDILIILVFLAGVYLYINQDTLFERDPRDTPHINYRMDGVDYPSSRTSVMPDIPKRPTYGEGFVISINNKAYRSAAVISPGVPIMAFFTHSNPDVSKIKMQHPFNKKLFLYLPLEQEVEIQNHGDYMLRGQYSASKFVAVDDQDRVYDEILIEFKP